LEREPGLQSRAADISAALRAAPGQQAMVARALTGIVGNQAIQRMLTPAPVQRFWDDAVETVEGWFSDDSETQTDGGASAPASDVQPPDTSPSDLDSQMPDDEFSDTEADPANDPAFQNAAEDAVMADSGGSWLDDFFDLFDLEEEPEPEPQPQIEGQTPVECAPLEQEIERLTQRMQELYAISEFLFPPLLKAKQHYESLHLTLPPNDPRLVTAREHYEALQRKYDAVLAQFEATLELRNAQRHVLEACSRAWEPKSPDIDDADLIS
jgi:hypothetical protein